MVELAIGQKALCVLTNTFVPGATGTVSGTVVDAGGNGIEGAQVTLSDEGNPVNAALTRTENTDGEGAYLFADVPTGTYSLTVTATGHQVSGPVSVIVTEGATTAVKPVVLPETEPSSPAATIYLPAVSSK